jgi:hypothetical protein
LWERNEGSKRGNEERKKNGSKKGTQRNKMEAGKNKGIKKEEGRDDEASKQTRTNKLWREGGREGGRNVERNKKGEGKETRQIIR